MDLFSILKDCKITKVLEGSSVAGTAAGASAVVEMDNYNDVLFIGGGMWTSGAGHLMKAQKCATTTGGTPVDLSGASATILNANQTALLEVKRPRDRLIRAVYIKAGVASAYWPIFAIQYNGRRLGNQATTSDADSGMEAVSVVSPTS